MREGEELTYLHGDHLGSASLGTDASGALLNEMRYTPYGVTRSGDMPTDRRFTDQRWESGLGLYDYGARFYSAALGRFVSADTIVPNPQNPGDFNRYAYAANNPLRYSDPSGHAYCPPGSIHCIDDTSPPGSYPGYRGSAYGIRFTADPGQTWHIRDLDAVLHAVTHSASAMWRAMANSYQIGEGGLDPAILDLLGPVRLFRETMENVFFHRSASRLFLII